MNSFKILPIVFLYLLASALAAPTTDSPAGQDSAQQQTTLAPNSPRTTPEASQQTTPLSNTTAKDETTATAHELLAKTSSFTCYSRSIGYYADVERECKVYHFCLLGEYNGDAVYQRITYLCLKDTIFDQQALDCVESSKASTPCKDSPSFYDSSNANLRQEIVGHKLHQGSETDPSNSTSSSSAPRASA